MSGPADLLGVLCAAVFGWGVWRCYPRTSERPNPVVVIALWSVVGPAIWMFFLALVGIGWETWLLVLPTVAALVLGIGRPTAATAGHRTPLVWVVPAAALAGGHALLVALHPASGWDFRYIWGLKAKVFALAATHDTRWLLWPPDVTQHPAYPPLWSDLIAMGIRLGGTPGGVAVVWDAFLVAALAATCWDILRDARPHLRLTGAAIGACVPLVLSSPYSGYADPVVAFLAAMALGTVVRLNRTPLHDPATLLSLSAAIAGLCLAKNEGMVFALGVTIAALWFADRRVRVVAALSFAVPAVSWQVYVALSGIPRDPLSTNALHWLAAGSQMLGWLRAQLVSPTSLLVLAWVLAGVALARRKTLPTVVALAIWWSGVIAAYLTSLDPIVWHLSTSFDRIIAAPLPAAISLALSANQATPGTEAHASGTGRSAH